MKQTTGAVVIAVIFVAAFSAYSLLVDDTPSTTNTEQAEIVIPLSKLLEEGAQNEASPEMEGDDTYTAPQGPIPELESFAGLEAESAEVQAGLDFLEGPF